MTSDMFARNAGAPSRLILASGSPRRRQLLADAGYAFHVIPANIDEENHPRLPAADLAEWLANRKAEAIAPAHLDDFILAADTVVGAGGQILSKPADAHDARRMLRLLAGSTHRVITGVALLRQRDGWRKSRHIVSSVSMRPLSDEELERYITGGQWQGKAGAYGIQDDDPFVTRRDGSLTNIVGLPMEETRQLLSAAGIEPAGTQQA